MGTSSTKAGPLALILASCALGAKLTTSYIISHSSGWPWSTIIGGGIAVAIIGWLAQIARDREQTNAQAVRDREALEIRNRSVVTDFVLYLRPFAATGRLVVKNPDYDWSITQNYYIERAQIDLELLLARNVEPLGSFVALGYPGEAIGAGRVWTDESNWVSRFEDLCARARAIVVVPAESKGVRYELEWIRDHGRLDACVFVMCPSINSSQSATPRAMWDGGRKIAAELGVNLPDYNPNGLVVRLLSDGRIRDTQQFNANGISSILNGVMRRAESREAHTVEPAAKAASARKPENSSDQSDLSTGSSIRQVCIFCGGSHETSSCPQR